MSNKNIYKFADAAEQKAYALLEFITEVVNGAGVFGDSNQNIVKIADHVYTVGGAVRNFVIGKPIKDIDMTIDSIALSTRRVTRDAAWLADLLVSKIPVDTNKVVDQYGVAKITIKGAGFIVNDIDLYGEEIEIATARKEYYRLGEYKPYKVEPTTIDEDVYRREFTFNTLLWRASDIENGVSRDSILDITGEGLKDLKDGVAKVPRKEGESYTVDTGIYAEEIGIEEIELDYDDNLGHVRQSYIHDASRIIRLIKFKFKYNFEISDEIESILLGPSPVPSQTHFVEVLNFIPHNHLYNLLTQVIFVNKENIKPSLAEMKRLKMLDVIVSMFNTIKEFETSLTRWIAENGPEYIFVFKDYGFNMNKVLGFLTEEEQERLRSVSSGMSRERAISFMEALRKPNDLFKDRSFYPELISGVPKRELGAFRAKFMPIAKDLIFSNQRFMDHPDEFKAAIRKAMGHGADEEEDLSAELGEDLEEASIAIDEGLITSSSQKSLDVLYAMIKVSNELDLRGLMKESDNIDRILSKYNTFCKFASNPNALKEGMIEKLIEIAEDLGQLAFIPSIEELNDMDISEIRLWFRRVKGHGDVPNNLKQKRDRLKAELEQAGGSSKYVDSMTMEEVTEELHRLRHPEISYFEESKQIISSFGFSEGEHVYVFDFDDTLMWTEEWHSSVVADDGGYVDAAKDEDGEFGGAGRSRSVARALRVFEESDSPTQLGLKKVIVDMPKMGKKSQTVFRVIRLSVGTENISSEELVSILGQNTVDRSGIDIREKYVDFPAVTVDHDFYANPETAGKIGPNPEIFQKYIEASSGRVIILTARANVPGMTDEINKVVMESGGRSPDHIFAKPRTLSGSKYKGEVILQMAKELGPSGKITFFDDNPRYTEGVLSALSGEENVAEVDVVVVSSENKPVTAFGAMSALAKFAGRLDAAGHIGPADAIDRLILKISSQNFEDREIMGPVMGILGLARKLEGSGDLVNQPPSKEDLIEEGREHGPAHLRRWFQIMKGEEVRGPDYNKKKQAVERVNELIMSSGLDQYGFDDIDMQSFDDMTLEQINEIKSSAEYVAGKINAMNSKNIIKISVSSGDIHGAVGDWSPPDGFEMLKNDSFHVTIISPQTIANFKDLLSENEYSDLIESVNDMGRPAVILSKNIGLAIRPEKKTYALAIENQQEFENYRDEIIDKISSAVKPLGSRVNPMNWWFERGEADRDRFFHVSIANDGDGWPTNSVADIRESDFEVS